jgi:hypothetical protein
MVLVNELYKTRSSGMCGEFSIECNPQKDQLLSLWVILMQDHVHFIS